MNWLQVIFIAGSKYFFAGQFMRKGMKKKGSIMKKIGKQEEEEKEKELKTILRKKEKKTEGNKKQFKRI